MSGNWATMEDYNWRLEDYDKRKVKKSAFDNYTHIKKVYLTARSLVC